MVFMALAAAPMLPGWVVLTRTMKMLLSTVIFRPLAKVNDAIRKNKREVPVGVEASAGVEVLARV